MSDDEIRALIEAGKRVPELEQKILELTAEIQVLKEAIEGNSNIIIGDKIVRNSDFQFRFR
jgi:hypothetical protein